MSPDTALLRRIIEAGNYIERRAMEPISHVDLISLETRLAEWHKTVAAELAWRDYRQSREWSTA